MSREEVTITLEVESDASWKALRESIEAAVSISPGFTFIDVRTGRIPDSISKHMIERDDEFPEPL